ncbi:GNAT family N-acetyltransferase [Micromonospora rifamycinica]|uniref:L-amino acid N-acyltransferase YncA n=1 Tax=Micromonospora rifamycinica TaxID=291594 RepID=A0A120F7Y0_9ACTN|nr:GNAT family N-acetyltransferase [Micromonospora rifamycinica]KWV30937.1 GCN5 family acetyltransferase [Micromonospora rifamycinica]SCG79774.1 L-amino acid N-acyltransferase YncA [Micromonospora rifamycinica]
MTLPATAPAIRPARPGDVPAVVTMVHELADYERAADQCLLTVAQLDRALFGPAPALFGHVAVDDDDRPVGFALWFLNFSTWAGVHGIYLEDLYVRPAHRGTGAGRALLAALAGICVERGYQRLDWSMIHWNPAARFYASVDADPMTEWVPYRLSGAALRGLAGRGVTAATHVSARPGRVPDRGDEA